MPGFTFRRFEDTVRGQARDGIGFRLFFGSAQPSGNLGDDVDPTGPQAFLIEMGPGLSENAHFHDTDQFQLFFAGESDGAQFGRHRMTGSTLHYTDAYRIYGPFSAGTAPLWFFTLRSRHATMRAYLPGDRAKLPYRGNREITAPVDGGASAGDRVIGGETDGLAAVTHTVAVGATATIPAPVESSGQYLCVLSGAVRHDALELGAWSLGYRDRCVPGEPPAELVAVGDEPARLLVVDFPYPATWASRTGGAAVPELADA